jgi:phosphatidylglycerol:prolipoprotein diacylglycerol transferase
MTFIIPYPHIDPVLISFAVGGYEFSLRWYALAYIAGLLIGWRLVVSLMRRPKLWPGETAPMTPAQPEELLTWMVLGVVLGGRLGYVLFYDPGRFLDHPGEIIRIWEGGMSFHGGFAGTSWRCCRWAMRWRWPPRWGCSWAGSPISSSPSSGAG